MLILNQRKDKVFNLDMVESIEVGYEIGKPYSVRAVFERQWDCEPRQWASEKLGEYKSSLVAEYVIKSIYDAYAQESRCFMMPEDTPDA